MGKVLILVFALSLVIERVTDKILYLVPARPRKIYAWIVSTALGLLISFVFRFGIMKELGLVTGLEIACWLDYLVTGILLASGSEPVHSIIDALAFKKEELQKRVKGV
ncbi:hypothetical protein AMJ83_06420 [candidate division WOR_3 bacterium SM23_42]|uniref:Uncharacterized protein n=1 Tax=candidate division WOR_3 bacterium SM23_42 TaxID=1703779 RepID=A0A0S8FTD4_UNCW3|nr:MAG: hypothetical protein AMJ83_06420 [candidate division WOR_3 bacterium SM23_42]